MQEEVDVCVNQAGEKSAAAEIYDFRVGRPGDFRADFFYCLALDEDFAGSGDEAGFYIEQARGVEDDGVRLRLRWCVLLRGLRWE